MFTLFSSCGAHFASASSFVILRNRRSSYGKVFPVLTAEKFGKRKFLHLHVQSQKVHSTKISELLMFSEISKLCVRKNFLSLS